ncbi:hypothetical protein I6I86_11715 (plasmid) [Moraxella osloensis]|nr:hypothetical protein [Moraxella osloensis]MBL7668595.1 hypothetical protein [Moraxella osloensis]
MLTNTVINELYKIFDMDDKHLHERYRTNSAYRLIRTKAIFNTIGHVEDLEIKAIKICGALGFIGKLTEIDKILETSSYIDRIKDVNKKLLPLLESSLINCQDSLDLLREIEDELQQEINLVYNESESPTNLKFLKIQKERLSPKEFLETYPNYHEIERKYRALRNNLFENHSDKTKVDTFIKNIEKYISTVEDYCAEA